MTPLSIITDLLRSIPSWLRSTLLALFALAVVGEVLCRIWALDLPYDKIDQTLVYVGGYLGVQSVANVRPQGRPQPVDYEKVEAVVNHRDDPLPFEED